MNRELFLRQLRTLLSDVTEEEREEAVRYYEEYFDEAGPEQEQALLAELGSPAKVAGIIRANVPGSRQSTAQNAAASARPASNTPASNAPDGDGRPGPSLTAAAETVAAGVESIRSRIRGLAEWDSAPHAPEPPRVEPDPAPAYEEPYDYAAEGRRYAAPQDGRRKLLVLFLLILFFPVWIGLLGGLIGLIGGAIGAFAGLIGGGIGAIFTGVFGLARAIPLLISSPANGMMALASCMLGIGVGILLFGVGVFCMGTLVPMAVRFVKAFCRRLFRRGGEVS